jgi:hypothetical protein
MSHWETLLVKALLKHLLVFCNLVFLLNKHIDDEQGVLVGNISDFSLVHVILI